VELAQLEQPFSPRLSSAEPVPCRSGLENIFYQCPRRCQNAGRRLDFELHPDAGLATRDLSFLKDIPIRERLSLQFRAEWFNALNRPNFNTPNAIVFTPSRVSPTAGVITRASSSSRQTQLALKFLW
jgi:hypothetical protein